MLSQRRYPVPTDPNFYDEQFYVHDRLGSVRLVVDYNDIDEYICVANSYTYTPFGQFYGTPDETVDNPFKFTGQWHDAEINQYYLRTRMYDPTMMRFTSRDPVIGKYQEPLSLHKYLYCANEPVNRFDLNGAYWEGIAEYEFWSEIGNEIIKGAAATLDGFNPIPCLNIFEDVYANSDGTVDGIYLASRLTGSASRAILSTALNAYAVNQILNASGVSMNLGARIVTSMLWKGVVVENMLGQGAALTVSGASALIGAMGVGDNIFDVMDAIGY